ncbi:uncharacterized protein LOC121304225 isoform X2 [Polyodon spathula]|uniref:uncharacterized protein LOC121304225 isoform X2 n=1 Tax=Polyodon spathula TaxID=7913 RepID=UPI001B7F61C1|nr:uncharacterized protein LOC121304225 isoform X2 [Polyodon spathula]
MERYKAETLFFMFIWLNAPVCIAVQFLQYPESLTVAPGQTVNITCALKNQTGLPVFVYHWYMKSAHQEKRSFKEEPLEENSRISIFQSENHSYEILTIRNVSAYDEGEYSCHVHFYRAAKDQIVNKILLFVKATPEIRLLARSVKQRGRSLICSAMGFYPSDLNLSWVYSPSREPVIEKQGSFMLNSDGTYSKNSSLQFENGVWNTGTEITCLVSHTRISYAVSSEAERSDSVTLTCSALSPYPPRVTLSWDSPPGGPPSSQQGPPLLIQDGIYNTSTSLQVEQSRWDEDFEVACVLKPRLNDETIIDDGNHGKWYYCSLIGLVFVVPLVACGLKRWCRKPQHLPDQKTHRRNDNGDGKSQCGDDLHYTTIQYKKQKDRKPQSNSKQERGDGEIVYSPVRMRGGNDQVSESIVYAALELQSRAPTRAVADRDRSTEYAAVKR